MEVPCLAAGGRNTRLPRHGIRQDGYLLFFVLEHITNWIDLLRKEYSLACEWNPCIHYCHRFAAARKHALHYMPTPIFNTIHPLNTLNFIQFITSDIWVTF